jgi:amidase
MQGIVPLAPSFDVCGWFARDIDVVIRVAQVLGRWQERTPNEVALLAPADLWALPDATVVEALAPARKRLEKRFGSADETALLDGSIDAWRETFRVCQAAEVWQAHGDWVSSSHPEFGHGIKQRFEMASRITHAERTKAEASRRAIRAKAEARFAPQRLMLLPTAPGPAPMRDADDETIEHFRGAALSLLCVAGLTGLPQLSIPGATVSGAPVGLSLVGASGQDALLLAVARELAAAR